VGWHTAAVNESAWGDLPEQLRDRIDDALRVRHSFEAMIMLCHEAHGPQLGLVEAQELVDSRFGWLSNRGEVEPEPVMQLDDLQARINAIPERVVAVEARWDGDTYGWLVELLAIIERPSEHHPRFDEICLAVLCRYDVLTPSSGPPRPGAADAIHFGRTVARTLDIPFYFSSPDTPDIDLPRWWDTLI
jgi:hypothetical protein